jgi:hypothetical protein
MTKALGNGARQFTAAEVEHIVTEDDSVVDERRHNAAYLRTLITRVYWGYRSVMSSELRAEMESVLKVEGKR